MGSVKEKVVSVAEKLLDCGGKPASEPCRENVYPQNAFVLMRGGVWREVKEFTVYGCCESDHHTIFWNLDNACTRMKEGDWLIEYVPIARYRCKTERVCG